jgi:glycosyltransferase involved in cell wall biosynthesis
MSEWNVLYLGTIVTEELLEQFDATYYSRAADNKKRGIIHSMQDRDMDVTIISPMLVNNNCFQYYSGTTAVDESLNTEVYVPGVFDAYGLNVLSLIITTSVLAVRLCLEREFDAAIFYDFKPEVALPGLVVKYLFSLRLVLEYEDGLFLHENPAIRIPAKVLRPTCGRIIDGAICVNKPLAGLLPLDNIVVVRGFPSIGMPDELPERSDCGSSPVIMFAGRFDRVRGIDQFIETIPNLEKDCEFWICGYGPEHEVSRVKKGVQEIESNVRFFGTLPEDEYTQRIVDADILVNFQDPESPISEYTFPSKILDFMSASSIIVSTDMSDLQEELGHIIHIVGEEEEKHVRLESILDTVDQDGSDLRGTNAEQWIRNNCSKHAVGESIDGLITEA